MHSNCFKSPLFLALGWWIRVHYRSKFDKKVLSQLSSFMDLSISLCDLCEISYALNLKCSLSYACNLRQYYDNMI